MKKFLLSLALVAFAATSMNAQTTTAPTQQVVAQAQKDCCKEHKDGKACDKPADQQCDDCKAKAKAMNHECKKEAKQCDKAKAMNHECKKEAKQCDKAKAMNHECKKEAKQCDKASAQKHECKDHKDGKACTKPADQQCPDCKEKAAKKN